MALDLAEKGEKVTVVDLDIVNPYFRTADFKELFGEHNISLTVPTYANSNLDIPRHLHIHCYLGIEIAAKHIMRTSVNRPDKCFKVESLHI